MRRAEAIRLTSSGTDVSWLHLVSSVVSLKDVLVFSAALGLDPYNIDYAEHVKGGLHERDGKARTAQSDSAAAVTAL